MNFLQISLTNRCNFACAACPMGKWRNSAAPRWQLCNEELIPWLSENVSNSDWLIELTGGEPSLYVGIDELLRWLSANKYKTLVKTNGSGDLPHLPHVKLVAAFHKLNAPPKNYDEYLIIDKLQREAKEAYCKEHKIPYKVIGFNKENFDNASHGFHLCAYVNPAGHQVGCQARSVYEDVHGDVDYRRITHSALVPTLCCKHCKAAIDAYRFIEGL